MAILRLVLLDSPIGSATYLPLHGSNNETEIILLTFFPSAICPHWLTFANRHEEMLKSSK